MLGVVLPPICFYYGDWLLSWDYIEQEPTIEFISLSGWAAAASNLGEEEINLEGVGFEIASSSLFAAISAICKELDD